MNHRDYKKFNNGSIAHIYNRGNNKGKIFFDEQDYKAFLFRLALALGFYQKELKGENVQKRAKKKREERTQKKKRFSFFKNFFLRKKYSNTFDFFGLARIRF